VEDTAMKLLNAPYSPAGDYPGAVVLLVSGPITRFMLKRGAMLGTPVGAVTGTYIAYRYLLGRDAHEMGLLLVAFGVGAGLGLFLGLCLALVDAVVLARFAPAVRSGKVRTPVAAAIAAIAAVIVVLGPVLFLTGGAWFGMSPDLFVMAAWAVSAWLGGTWFGISALYSALNPVASWLPPLSQDPPVHTPDPHRSAR
jgi:hypothetical protein